MAKHYATKVNDSAEKNEYLKPIENAIVTLESINFNYLSSGELNKLHTLSKKLYVLYDEVSLRMEKDINQVSIKEEEKEKRKEISKKLKNLSPEEMDKLLSQL